MGAYHPDLFPVSTGRTNVQAAETFYLKVVYGSAAIASAQGKDLQLADTATGKMTVTFPRTYRELLGFSWGWASCAAGAVYFPVILTDDLDTASSSGGGTLVIETRTEAGTATDPASGDVLILRFDVSLDVTNDNYAITVT
jgi:hypothetical protein